MTFGLNKEEKKIEYKRLLDEITATSSKPKLWELKKTAPDLYRKGRLNNDQMNDLVEVAITKYLSLTDEP